MVKAEVAMGRLFNGTRSHMRMAVMVEMVVRVASYIAENLQTIDLGTAAMEVMAAMVDMLLNTSYQNYLNNHVPCL